MSEEQAIQAELTLKFPCLRDKVRVTRTRRIFAEVPTENFGEVFDYAVKQMGFSILCAITGMDFGQAMGAIYHLARESGVTLNLSRSMPKEQAVFETVMGYFPAAEVYERELIDLFGMQVQGLPPGPRYPLPDDWPAGQHPLRKDWKIEMLPGDAKQKGEAEDA